MRHQLLRWWQNYKRDFPWRRSRASRYHQVVSEILQRTQAATVARFWPNFAARFPNWQSIAEATTHEIERNLRAIGLSKQRAPRLRGLATAVAKAHGRFPSARHDIEALPGVGQYIANAIELFAGKKCRPLIDGNMARVLERYFGPRKLADIRFDPYLQQLAARVVCCRQARQVNWAILDLAALVCRPNPNCPACPLKSSCNYRKSLFSTKPRNSSAAATRHAPRSAPRQHLPL